MTDAPAPDDTSGSDRRRSARLEIVAVILLSLTAIGTAWTGFQSAKWSGVMSISFSEANAQRTESVRRSNAAAHELQLDVGLFTAWVQAIAEDDERLADFLTERFPDRLRVATDAWLETEPLVSPDAPSSPFRMDEYVLVDALESERLERAAEESAAWAREANQRSDNYVLTTIMFASVLFFAGISTKLHHPRPRAVLTGVAAVVFVAAVVVLSTFPVEI